MPTRTLFVAAALAAAVSCTVKPPHGRFACSADSECPEGDVCRQVSASKKRCVDPRTPAWQGPGVTDASVDADVETGTAVTHRDAGDTGTRPDDPDSSLPRGGAGGAGDFTAGSGGSRPMGGRVQVSGGVTVLRPGAAATTLHVTEAMIELLPTSCGQPGSSSGKRLCVTGGIRP